MLLCFSMGFLVGAFFCFLLIVAAFTGMLEGSTLETTHGPSAFKPNITE
jgi:hypothetical protein